MTHHLLATILFVVLLLVIFGGGWRERRGYWAEPSPERGTFYGFGLFLFCLILLLLFGPL